MPEAVIASVVRSPIGRAKKGSLKGLRPDDMAAQMVEAALAEVPELDPAEIDDLMLGCARPGGQQGFNMARIVSQLVGLDQLPGTTLTRYCASSVQTTRMALHAIRAGEGDAFISAGVESVSSYPEGTTDPPEARNPIFAEASARTNELVREGGTWTDPRLVGGLPDAYIAMGQTAENVAQVSGITRREQDEFAVRSQQRAEQAAKAGFWSKDITPLRLSDGTLITKDDGPRAGVTLEGVSQLAPVFRENGTVTAGNCCPLNDGAAALVVMSDTKAAQLGVIPLARVVSTGVCGLSAELMGLGPIGASRQALARAGMEMSDIDLVEINEAFAAQVIASARKLGVDENKLNVNGGAIALGHPFGMTGARVTATLIHSLQESDGELGLLTMCVGGGQGMAMILERLS